jgi:hypothetical protein
MPEVPEQVDAARGLPALRHADGARVNYEEWYRRDRDMKRLKMLAWLGGLPMHPRCTHADWDADAGAMVACTRAGTHGDPRYPNIRWCTTHRQMADELLIRPSPVSSTAPPTQRWEQHDG